MAGYRELSGKAVTIQAELPLHTSDSSLLSTSDHMSAATQPQDAMHTLQNTIGQEYWQYAGRPLPGSSPCRKAACIKSICGTARASSAACGLGAGSE